MKNLTLQLSSQYEEDELLAFIAKFNGTVHVVEDDELKNFIHDLRNPLSAIKLQARLLRKFKDDQEKIGDLDQKFHKLEEICDKLDSVIEAFITRRSRSF